MTGLLRSTKVAARARARPACPAPHAVAMVVVFSARPTRVDPPAAAARLSPPVPHAHRDHPAVPTEAPQHKWPRDPTALASPGGAATLRRRHARSDALESECAPRPQPTGVAQEQHPRPRLLLRVRSEAGEHRGVGRAGPLPPSLSPSLPPSLSLSLLPSLSPCPPLLRRVLPSGGGWGRTPLRTRTSQQRKEAAGALAPRAPLPLRAPLPHRQQCLGGDSPAADGLASESDRDHVHHRDVFVMAAVGPGGAAVRARVSRPARRGHRRRRARRAIRSWHAPSHMGGGGRLPASPSPKLSPRKHRGPSSHPRPGRAGPPPSLSFSHSLGEGSHSSCGSSPPTGVGRRPTGPTRR